MLTLDDFIMFAERHANEGFTAKLAILELNTTRYSVECFLRQIRQNSDYWLERRGGYRYFVHKRSDYNQKQHLKIK